MRVARGSAADGEHLGAQGADIHDRPCHGGIGDVAEAQFVLGVDDAVGGAPQEPADIEAIAEVQRCIAYLYGIIHHSTTMQPRYHQQSRFCHR